MLVVRVHVEQWFFRCSKAFLRSELLKHEAWPEQQKISFGKVFAERLGVAVDVALVEVIDASIAEDARVSL